MDYGGSQRPSRPLGPRRVTNAGASPWPLDARIPQATVHAPATQGRRGSHAAAWNAASRGKCTFVDEARLTLARWDTAGRT